MSTNQPQSIQSIYLRLLPIILPVISALTAVVALGRSSQHMPDLANLEFVLYVGFLSGLIPLCILVGLVFMTLDFVSSSQFFREDHERLKLHGSLKDNTLRTYSTAASVLVIVGVVVLSIKLGQQINF